MSKRGLRRPWRVRYEWENGVKGVITESSRDRAEGRRDELLRNAEARGMEIKVTITDRDHTAQFAVGDKVQLREALDIFGTVTAVNLATDEVEVDWSGNEPTIKAGTVLSGPASRVVKV